MDHHNKPFDEATLAKLQIFEQYTLEWLPTFLSLNFSKLVIVDFFAGPGYDIERNEGSPIRTLKVISKFSNLIKEKGVLIEIYFNEFKKKKLDLLKDACIDFLQSNPEITNNIKIKYSQLDFENAFNDIIPEIKRYPSLVLLDQNGIKYLTIEFLLKLENTFKTDFLYFVSSSYFKRFGDSEEFNRYFSFDLEEANKYPYKFIHNVLLKQIKEKLPESSELKLFPFTIRKGANIHGLLFGSKNLKGVEKFLNVAWSMNPINGSANFDIDDDESKRQLKLFDNLLTKLEKFQNNLEDLIETKKEIYNSDIYIFTLQEGHIPGHATKHLLKLKKDKYVFYEGSGPKINYNSTKNISERKIVKWIKK
jgi:three-Cys-motif partner protein